MNKMGVFHGLDLKKQSLSYLTSKFGKSGKHYYNIVRGIQHSRVNATRVRKSIAAERTFEYDLHTKEEMLEKLTKIAEELEKRIRKADAKGRTITLKIKFNDFTQITRSKTAEFDLEKEKVFFPIIKQLLDDVEISLPVRLLGISLSNLANDSEEQTLSYIQLSIEF